MDVGEEKEGEIVFLRVRGRLDSASAGALEEALLRHLGGGATRIVVDFAELEFLSSAGLRILLFAAKKLKAGGRFVVCSVPEAVNKVIELSGFHRVLAIAPSRAEAVTLCA